MADGGAGDSTNGVSIDVDGGVIRVDVRPHGLIAQLRSSPEAQTTVVAQSGGQSAHRTVSASVRQGSFRLTETVTVEATSGSDFAAVAHPDGRCLVVAFSGDVVVLPSGEDRFALASHEALLVPAAGGPGEVKVMATESLSPETQGEVTEMVEHAASLLAAPPAAPAPATAAQPEEPRRKKTKKERREEKAARAAAAKAARKSEEDAAAAAVAAGGDAASETDAAEAATGKGEKPEEPGRREAAAGPTKPAKKQPAERPARRRAEEPRGPKVAAATGGAAPDTADDVSGSRGRRGLYVAIAAVILLLLGVVAIGTMNDEDDVATVGPTTTAAPETTAVETTLPPTTEPPTTAAPPVANYDFVPQRCVQEGESITYTASITNNAAAPFDFVVEVAFKDPSGDTVTTDEVTLVELQPGATETISASGSVGRDLAGSGATCAVERVEAAASA